MDCTQPKRTYQQLRRDLEAISAAYLVAEHAHRPAAQDLFLLWTDYLSQLWSMDFERRAA